MYYWSESLSACGLNTDISLRLRKYNGKDFEEIETHKFHKFGKILSQDNGFLLTDINLPEPENLNEALLMRETGGSVYKLDINMTGKAKDTYNDNALIVMGCTFDLKPISQSNIKTSMDDLYSDLSSSDDRIDEYKADAIADLLVERNTIIQNYVRIHQSWGVERKEYYDEFSNMDLEDVSSVIRQNVKFFLAPDSPIDIYSTSTLHGGERRKFYEKSGTFFDDFDAKLVERLGLLNSRECPSKVDNLENRLSPSLYFIMEMERRLAAYTGLAQMEFHKSICKDIG